MATPLKDLLKGSVNQAGIGEQVGAAVVCVEFDKIILEVLGDQIKDKVRALYVKNGTLTVAVLSSAIGQEIKLHEQEILEKLSKKAEGRGVNRLRFLV
ncbi:MAG: DUF721 domain-containing protein [Patescibacteria group bacterium]